MKTAKLASQQRHGQEYSLAASRRVINFQGTLRRGNDAISRTELGVELL
jgi:hypothetical protein